LAARDSIEGKYNIFHQYNINTVATIEIKFSYNNNDNNNDDNDNDNNDSDNGLVKLLNSVKYF